MTIDQTAMFKELAEEIKQVTQNLAAQYGDEVVEIACELSNFGNLIAILNLNGNIPKPLVDHITNVFANVAQIACRYAKVDTASLQHLVDVINGYKRTLADELTEKFSKMEKDDG